MAKAKAGKLSPSDLLGRINKIAGRKVAHDLEKDNPTDVIDWIPTGAKWLDAITCKGKWGGIPVGKITEIAGLEATGKSFLAAQVCASAQKKGILPVYFDSESAIDSNFLVRSGVDISDGKFIYVQAQSVEFVLEVMEQLMGDYDDRLLFVWDSLAFTPAVSDVEGDFNPQSSMAVKARILAKACSKLAIPIADKQATWLVLNQLKANITRRPAEAMTTPYITPGGKAMSYSYSLRIWLTGRKAKASYVVADNGFRVGSEVKAKIEKSRFGTQGRLCNFKILWGTDEVGVQDEESWFDALSGTPVFSGGGGGWYNFEIDGYEKRFRSSNWVTLLREDEEFRANVLKAIEKEVIVKFDKQEGDASSFYESDEEVA
jgi:recombination protein RecA